MAMLRTSIIKWYWSASRMALLRSTISVSLPLARHSPIHERCVVLCMLRIPSKSVHIR